MRKTFLLLLCLVLFLSGCTNTADPTNDTTVSNSPTTSTTAPQDMAEPTSPSTEEAATLTQAEVSTTEAASLSPEEEALALISAQLEEAFSYQIHFSYHNFPTFGFEESISQDTGADGSFHFLVQRRQWSGDEELTDKMEYYYRYEYGSLACYMRSNDQAPQRAFLTPDTKTQMEADEAKVYRSAALLPSFLEEFTQLSPTVYSFRLPLEQLLDSDSKLSNQLQTAFSFSEADPESANNISIPCNIEVEEDSLRPIKLSYDFTELKPLLFSDGALSAEYALDLDLLSMTYEFDYTLADSIDVPQEFIP